MSGDMIRVTFSPRAPPGPRAVSAPNAAGRVKRNPCAPPGPRAVSDPAVPARPRRDASESARAPLELATITVATAIGTRDAAILLIGRTSSLDVCAARAWLDPRLTEMVSSRDCRSRRMMVGLECNARRWPSLAAVDHARGGAWAAGNGGSRRAQIMDRLFLERPATGTVAPSC